jgi:hypothetical protein
VIGVVVSRKNVVVFAANSGLTIAAFLTFRSPRAR